MSDTMLYFPINDFANQLRLCNNRILTVNNHHEIRAIIPKIHNHGFIVILAIWNKKQRERIEKIISFAIVDYLVKERGLSYNQIDF